MSLPMNGLPKLTKGVTATMRPYMRWSKPVAEGVIIVYMNNNFMVCTGPNGYDWGTVIGTVTDDPWYDKPKYKVKGIGQIHYYYRETPDSADMIIEGDFECVEDAAIALAKKRGFLK